MLTLPTHRFYYAKLASKYKESPMITQTYDELLALVLRTRKQGVELYDFLVRHFHTDTRTQALKSLLTQEQELLQQASSLYPRDIYQESCQNLQALQNLVPKQYILPDISTLCEEICVHNFDLTQSLYIALGMETSHIHMCDIFLKLQSQKLEQDSYLDMLYRLEALSYNHHIPLLHSLLSCTDSHSLLSHLQALLGQQNIAQVLAPLQTSMKEIQDIVQKLQNKQISHQELTQFLEKVNFSLVGGGILGSFCAIIANEFLYTKKE